MTFSAEVYLPESPLPQPVTTVVVPLRWSTFSAKARPGKQMGTMYLDKGAGDSRRSRAMSLSTVLEL